MFAVCSIDTNNLFESFNNCSKLGFSNNNDTIIFKYMPMIMIASSPTDTTNQLPGSSYNCHMVHPSFSHCVLGPARSQRQASLPDHLVPANPKGLRTQLVIFQGSNTII